MNPEFFAENIALKDTRGNGVWVKKSELIQKIEQNTVFLFGLTPSAILALKAEYTKIARHPNEPITPERIRNTFTPF